MRTNWALKFQVATTPALVMASTVLRLPADALDEMVSSELTSNPALQAQWRPTRTMPAHVSQATGDVLDMAEHLPARESAIDQLITQANLIAGEPNQKWVTCLLYSLDEHGFLTADLGELAQAFCATPDEMRHALRILHTLHPLGIGARNIQECLLIQCVALCSEHSPFSHMQQRCICAMRIIEHAWDHFLHQRDAQVVRTLGITIADVDDARRFMREHLHPYPMQLVQNTTDDPVVLAQADMIVCRIATPSGPAFEVEIPAAGEYTMHINPEFEQLLHHADHGNADANTIQPIQPVQLGKIQQAVEQARRFIDAVHHRWETLQRIGDFLAVHQAEFFERGPRCLKPLTRARLADALSVHESTVSRAVSDKTIQLPSGKLMPLDDLFDASLAPKEVIRQLLAQPLANHAHRPLSDQVIVARLQAQGIYLSRRTVAKYRQQMGLPARYRS